MDQTLPVYLQGVKELIRYEPPKEIHRDGQVSCDDSPDRLSKVQLFIREDLLQRLIDLIQFQLFLQYLLCPVCCLRLRLLFCIRRQAPGRSKETAGEEAADKDRQKEAQTP